MAKSIKEIMNGKKVQFYDEVKENRIEFLKMCDSEDILWVSGRKADDIDRLDYNYISIRNQLTIINCIGYKIINLKELKIMMNEFTKEELKSAIHVVELRNGSRFLVLGNRIVNDGHYLRFSRFDSTLLYDGENHSDFNILKVYIVNDRFVLKELLEAKCMTLVWERDEKSEQKLKIENQIADLERNVENAVNQIKELKELLIE